MNRSRRTAWIVGLVLVGGGLLGGLLGNRTRADAEPASDQLKTFAHILALVEENYVGDTDTQELVEGAIQGMLRTLDPHSNYLDRHSYNEMRDEQRGKFYGLGIQIAKRGPDKPLTIIAPIDDTPARRAGLLAGDIIFKIEGEETRELTVQEAVSRLKGDRGTKVTITIQRPGEELPFDVTLVRDEISTHSVPVAMMLTDEVGYIRISTFTTKTSEELDESIRALEEQGMKRLLFDLRGNPGGLLEQAVAVAERFVPPGKMVVYTRGRIPGSDQDYLASKGARRIEIPLVVLVNHSSASASEIVSGAIQDHDRGLLVGETTFGKGLVQRVIPLHGGGALALTTAKYYTPSGRLIQRDYTDIDDYFFDVPPDENQEEPIDLTDREVRYTDSGRIVYGGGGITPDYVVRNPRLSPFLSRLTRENLIFEFGVEEVARNGNLDPDFRVDDAMLQRFRGYLDSSGQTYEPKTFEDSRAMLAMRLRAQIARLKWGVEAETRALAEADPQIQKAMTLFEEAARLVKAGERAREEKERQARVQASPATL